MKKCLKFTHAQVFFTEFIPVIQDKIGEGDCQINFIPTLEDEDEFFIQIQNSKLGTRNYVADNAGLPGLRHRDPDSRTNTNQRWKLVRLGDSKILIKSTSTGLVLDAGIEHSCGLISPHVFSRMNITCFDQLSATQVWNCCKIPEKLEIDSPILFVPTREENRFMIQVITNIGNSDKFLTVNDDSTIVLSSRNSKDSFQQEWIMYNINDNKYMIHSPVPGLVLVCDNALLQNIVTDKEKTHSLLSDEEILNKFKIVELNTTDSKQVWSCRNTGFSMIVNNDIIEEQENPNDILSDEQIEFESRTVGERKSVVLHELRGIWGEYLRYAEDPDIISRLENLISTQIQVDNEAQTLLDTNARAVSAAKNFGAQLTSSNLEMYENEIKYAIDETKVVTNVSQTENVTTSESVSIDKVGISRQFSLPDIPARAATKVSSVAEATAIAEANASASVESSASASAVANAKAEATAEAKAVSAAEASSTAQAKATAQSDASAQAQAEASAEATASASAQATANASAQASANASAQATANASAQASANASAQASSNADASASAAATAEANATSTATASASANANASASATAAAHAQSSAQSAAAASASAKASATAAAEASANAAASASAKASASANASAVAEASASSEAVASASAKASAITAASSSAKASATAAASASATAVAAATASASASASAKASADAVRSCTKSIFES